MGLKREMIERNGDAAAAGGVGARTPFARLAEVSGALEGQRGRNALADQVGAFLRELAPDEIAPAARMLIGRPFAEADPRTLDLSWTAVWSVLGGLIGGSSEERERVFGEHVDA